MFYLARNIFQNTFNRYFWEFLDERFRTKYHHNKFTFIYKTAKLISYYSYYVTLFKIFNQKHSFADPLQDNCYSNILQYSKGKHVLQSLFNKVECLKACYFMKKRIRQSCFPVNIAKYLIASFIEHHRMLLLYFFEVSPGELFFRLPKKNWRTLNKYYQENWTYQFFCISRLLRRPTSNKFWHKKINHKGALGKLLYFMVLFGLF